ncbi:MAG: protein kinase [Myxococcales bacterium]|nr:protein kinase [Myxococcales bacterium]
MSGSSPTPQGAILAACPTCKAVFRGGFQRCPNDGSRLAPGADDPLVGTVLAERYQIDQVIGDGGIGRVYRARHVRMSRAFAIKVPFGELGYDRKARARFANEAEAASRLSHPNVIGVVDVGETREGLFYMAMDLAEGPSLATLLDDGPLPAPRVLAILVQLADGLAHAHDRGLVHRDLKPDNVILTAGPDGGEQVRIVDFGLAIVDADAPRDRLTTEGVVLGTPHYMAPEQATDEALDLRTDLFALGLIVYELLAGVHPFDGAPIDVARQNLSRELPPIRERAGVEVEPVLEALIRWLTQKAPADRPASTGLVVRLARALAAGDVAGARALLPERLRPPAAAAPAPAPAPAPVPAPAPTPSAASAAPPALDAGVADLTAAPDAATEPARPRPATLPEEVFTRPARRARRLALVAVALLALAVLAIVLVTGGGGHDQRAATVATADAAPDRDPEAAADAATGGVPDHAGEPARDAGHAPDPGDPVGPDDPVGPGDPVDPIRVAPGDAGAPRPRAIDAGPRPAPRPDAAVSRPRPVDAGPPPRAPDAGATAAADNATLRQLYEQVGRALDQAITRHGRDATEVLRRRYAAIPPYLEAVRKDELRAQAERQLRALAADLAALK